MIYLLIATRSIVAISTADSLLFFDYDDVKAGLVVLFYVNGSRA
jgi:hypothetical protein